MSTLLCTGRQNQPRIHSQKEERGRNDASSIDCFVFTRVYRDRDCLLPRTRKSIRQGHRDLVEKTRQPSSQMPVTIMPQPTGIQIPERAASVV